MGSPISRCSSTRATSYPAAATFPARYPPAGPAPITTTSKERAEVTTFRHHSFRFMMISRKFSRCFDREALSVYPQADRSGAAIKAEAPSTITSVAMSPFRWTEDAPCGIFWLEGRRPAAGRNRDSFLAVALEDLVRGRPRDVRRLRDRLRAAVTVRDERDVPAGLVSGEADGLEGLHSPLELLLQVHSLSEELRQVLRNHGARYPRTPLYLFETAGGVPLCGPNLPSGPMGSARPALLALIVVLMVFWSVVPSTQGQGPAGNLVVSTDYELFGTYDLRGGGHVTWTWTGSRATDFRLKLLHLFDEYTTIPRGFVYAGATTNANRDGRLDSLEGVAYTDLLERSLEYAPRRTQSQYLQMLLFDLRDKTGDPATSFDRSTSGLAGANASTSSPVEIRFLFEANITTTNGRVPLATSALVSPVYQIFSYRAVQSPMLNSSGSYPGSWPFLPENGWHVVTVGGRAAFWAGNDTTGLYDNNLDASSRTSADPPLAADPAYVPFDLRFASNAWATFNYTGSVRPGDYLRLEYAHPPAYTDWTSLSFSSGPTLPSTAPLQWANATVDLSSLLGQQVRLRFRFHSDGALTASGFYIRDFDLHAPADYTGEVVEADTHYLIGLLSFSDPSVSAGGLQLIRTPGGELVTYGATWDPSRVPRDTIQFRTFDLLENPQILFVVMIAATYAISRLQHGAYERYRASYPAEYRPAALRNKWIHRAGKVGIGILILFYFVPTALWFVGLRAVVSGLAFWFLSVAMAVGFGYGTRASYDPRPL